MSLKARRLAPGVATARFGWQSTTTPIPASRPVPLTFAPLSRGEAPTIEPDMAVEAREIRLPSPSLERQQAIEQEAFAAGFAHGERLGTEAATARLDAVIAAFHDTIDELHALRPELMRHTEREIVHLAVVIAERILRHEVDVDPDLILVLARVAVDRLGERAAARVHLNPTDSAAISPAARETIGSIEIVADPAVERGGCLVRSAFGVIDAGIDAQIRALSRELLGGVDDEREGEAQGVRVTH
jgi:flagellar assembly protein FliH